MPPLALTRPPWSSAAVVVACLSLAACLAPTANIESGRGPPPSRAVAPAPDVSRWPFGAAERPFTPRSYRPSSIDLLKQIAAEGFPVPPDWKPYLRNFADQPPIHQLTTVNSLVNSVPYRSDGPQEEWRHPRLFLEEGGDCDCYAVAKYGLLRSLGYRAQQLRVTLVSQQGDQPLHALLAVEVEPKEFGPYLLDSRQDEIISARYATYYRPLVSASEDGIWQHGPGDEKSFRPFLDAYHRPQR